MRNIAYIVTLTVLIGLFSGCNKKAPTNLWETRPEGDPTPEIQSIVPANRAEAGVLDILIRGKHFGPSADQNFVYFDDVQVEVLSADTNEIKVVRPNVTGDSIIVSVVARNATQIGIFDTYAVDPVISSFGTFLPVDQLLTIAADKDGNVYVAFNNGRIIRKYSPDGQATDYANWSGFTPSDMAIGPDGFLYLQRNKKNKLYGVAAGGGKCKVIATYKDAMRYFDFDENGNIFAGGSKKNLNIVRPDDSADRVADYTSFNINAVRVYQNYVYVLAENVTDDTTLASGVYRHEITSSDGTLGPAELVLDWSGTGEYADSDMLDINFSADGDMYIGTDNVNPILIVSLATGKMRSLYKGILTTPVEEIIWYGNDIYQRLGDDNIGITKIAMGEAGAPYYGR